MKSKWTCPICQTVLTKGKDKDGEGIKSCPKCGASWFLLLCRHPKKEFVEAEEVRTTIHDCPFCACDAFVDKEKDEENVAQPTEADNPKV